LIEFAEGGEMKGRLIRQLIAFVAAAAGSVPAVAAQYDVIDLGTIGGSASVSLSINDRGQVVGGSTTVGDVAFHAFVGRLGKSGPVLQDLEPLLGGTTSQAMAINANGDIAAATVLDGRIRAAVLYNGTAKQIGTLGGMSSVARGLNNKGEVVGYSAVAGDDQAHAFVFSHGDLLDLGTLGGTNSTANAINNRGDVVGSSETSTSDVTQAFLYTGGGLRGLGTLGGKNSYAVAINNEGSVVGSANTANGTTHAFLFAGGKMTDLGTLGGNDSDAFGINEDAEIVGRAQFATDDSRTHAFFLGRCQMIDLNSSIPSDSGWVLQEARAINEDGEIVGFGQHQGQTHSFLLVPREESKGSAAESCNAGDQRQRGGK
jgi:probable HAF family extracellular repeat protein